MDMQTIYGKAENTEEGVLGLRNTSKDMTRKLGKVGYASDSKELLEIVDQGLKAMGKLERLKADVLAAETLIMKQRVVLIKKLKEEGRAIKPTTYYTRINDRRKVLYVAYHIENVEEEHHLVVNSMFKKYIEKRLTIPALMINFSSLAELKRIALEKNILID